MQTDPQRKRGGVGPDPAFDAKINERWENFINGVIEKMDGSIEEKQRILRQRVLRFFQNYHLDSERFYTERKDVSPQNFDLGTIFQTSILVFGIDFLSIDKLRLYFQPYQVEISIYDDSHCSVNFPDASQLVQCLFERLVEKPNNSASLLDFFRQKPEEMVVWRQIKGYKEMLFEKRMWARFSTKEDDLDLKNGNPRRKMMELFGKAKIQFLNQVEKNQRKAKGIKSDFNRRYGKGWKSEANQSCTQCDDRMNRLKKVFPCEHSRCFGEEKGGKSDNGSQFRGGRRKHRQTEGEYINKLKSYQGKGMTLAPIIEKITGKGTPSKFHNNPPIPSINKESPAQKNTANKSLNNMSLDSELYREMLNEFNRYSPFDSISDIDPKDKSETQSEAGVSYFDRDEGQI